MCHAAGESCAPLGRDLPAGTRAVVLAAPDERTLSLLADRLARAGVRHALVVESDAPLAGQLVAIGLRPAPREEVRRHVSSLPLLR